MVLALKYDFTIHRFLIIPSKIEYIFRFLPIEI